MKTKQESVPKLWKITHVSIYRRKITCLKLSSLDSSTGAQPLTDFYVKEMQK